MQVFLAFYGVKYFNHVEIPREVDREKTGGKDEHRPLNLLQVKQEPSFQKAMMAGKTLRKFKFSLMLAPPHHWLRSNTLWLANLMLGSASFQCAVNNTRKFFYCDVICKAWSYSPMVGLIMGLLVVAFPAQCRNDVVLTSQRRPNDVITSLSVCWALLWLPDCKSVLIFCFIVVLKSQLCWSTTFLTRLHMRPAKC